jgi:thiol:disulfide interchange protein DsbD
MLMALSAQASIFGGSSNQPLDVEQAFVLTGGQTASDRVDLVWQVADDYYLYQDRIEIEFAPGIDVLSREDSATDTKDDPLFGEVQVFHKIAQVGLTIGRADQSVPGSSSFKVTYQGCWEGGICYPPVTKELSLADVGLIKVGQIAATVAESAETPAGAQVDTSGASSTPATPLSAQDQFVETLTKASLMSLLAIFFVAGLALSMTPCVFPMIPILSGIIAGQGHRVNTRRGLALSVVYVLAMAVTYTIAGVIAGLFGANLQVALQEPWVISIFSLIFVGLALSMFGFYDLQFPSAFQTWLTRGSDRQKGGTYAGVAVMGFLSALIVGPCMAAPLAGALIYIGQTGDPLLGGMALFVMSLGMGVPLILIGTSAAKVMPRAGVWMESVKAGFGVVLLLMAIWMLDRVVPTEVSMLLSALVLIVSSIYMGVFNTNYEGVQGWAKFFRGLGVVLLVYGIALLLGLLSGGKSFIYPLQSFTGNGAGGAVASTSKLNFATITTNAELDRMLAVAQRNGQPVMLDYYADWCVSCSELDYVTFADTQVQQALQSVLLIKVDVTANDAEAKQLTQRYEVLGPPTLQLINSAGEWRKDLTLIGVPAPQELLNNLQRL